MINTLPPDHLPTDADFQDQEDRQHPFDVQDPDSDYKEALEELKKQEDGQLQRDTDGY